MFTSLVLTVVGRDRPGLVSVLSKRISEHDGNWLDSRMANLAGQFAGLLLVQVPTERANALVATLQELEAQGLRVLIEHGETPAAAVSQAMQLELTGHDRPGIVRDISETLAQRAVSIDEMQSRSFSASFSGETLFEMKANLRVPENVDQAMLKSAVEALATDLIVEIHVTL
ncbi:MAG: glycine cleavage system protein R [Burkholderiaceae bacterium]